MEGLRAKGIFRLQIKEDGKVVGDSGWKENIVVNLGFNEYLVKTLGKISGSSQVGYMALGTGTEPGAGEYGPQINGEVSSRTAVTGYTSSLSKTCRFLCTFDSSGSFVGATVTLKNIGLAASANSAAGTIFCGNTYATSTCATNQNVNCTYDIIFS